jgi:PilZ domain
MERRCTTRMPLRFAVRLRVGTELYEGHSSDVDAHGACIQVVEQSLTQHTTAPRLHSDDRGALELFIGESDIVVRIRIARIQRRRGHVYLGLAMDDPGEAVRLAQVLAQHGYIANSF